MTKNEIISLRISALIAGGASVRSAVDQVLGAGTYQKIASDVYDALAHKSGK